MSKEFTLEQKLIAMYNAVHGETCVTTVHKIKDD